MSHDETCKDVGVDESLSPTEPASGASSRAPNGRNPDGNTCMNEIRRRFGNRDRRYLVQLRCDSTPSDANSDPRQGQLADLQATIGVVDGQLEHHWGTPREYDLILVIRLQSHQASYTALEMAIEAIPFVRAVHSTPLHPLDRAVDEHQSDLEQVLGADVAALDIEQCTDGAHGNGHDSTVLEPMNWDAY